MSRDVQLHTGYIHATQEHSKTYPEATPVVPWLHFRLSSCLKENHRSNLNAPEWVFLKGIL